MLYVAPVLALVFLAVFVYDVRARASHFGDHLERMAALEVALQALSSVDHTPLYDRIALLEADVEGLPRKWEDVRRLAAAAETRARYHATRALDQLEEAGLTSPGLEGIAQDLFGVDGGGGPERELLPVSENVAVPPTTLDWYAETQRMKYGA